MEDDFFIIYAFRFLCLNIKYKKGVCTFGTKICDPIENCAHYGKNKPYQEVENDNNFCKKPDVCLSPETEILDTVGKKTI